MKSSISTNPRSQGFFRRLVPRSRSCTTATVQDRQPSDPSKNSTRRPSIGRDDGIQTTTQQPTHVDVLSDTDSFRSLRRRLVEVPQPTPPQEEGRSTEVTRRRVKGTPTPRPPQSPEASIENPEDKPEAPEFLEQALGTATSGKTRDDRWRFWKGERNKGGGLTETDAVSTLKRKRSRPRLGRSPSQYKQSTLTSARVSNGQHAKRLFRAPFPRFRSNRTGKGVEFTEASNETLESEDDADSVHTASAPRRRSPTPGLASVDRGRSGVGTFSDTSSPLTVPAPTDHRPHPPPPIRGSSCLGSPRYRGSVSSSRLRRSKARSLSNISTPPSRAPLATRFMGGSQGRVGSSRSARQAQVLRKPRPPRTRPSERSGTVQTSAALNPTNPHEPVTNVAAKAKALAMRMWEQSKTPGSRRPSTDLRPSRNNSWRNYRSPSQATTGSASNQVHHRSGNSQHHTSHEATDSQTLGRANALRKQKTFTGFTHERPKLPPQRTGTTDYNTHQRGPPNDLSASSNDTVGPWLPRKGDTHETSQPQTNLPTSTSGRSLKHSAAIAAYNTTPTNYLSTYISRLPPTHSKMRRTLRAKPSPMEAGTMRGFKGKDKSGSYLWRSSKYPSRKSDRPSRFSKFPRPRRSRMSRFS